MVQSGWRLEYCAAAEDSTYCPDNFDEFFKQRRRWIPSTLANLILLISEWKLTVNNNDYISFGFILYQALMVFSTVIRLGLLGSPDASHRHACNFTFTLKLNKFKAYMSTSRLRLELVNNTLDLNCIYLAFLLLLIKR